jgi:hypothetical protein
MTPTDDADQTADLDMTRMKQQLDKDVAFWSTGRSEDAVRRTTEMTVAAAKPVAAKPVKRAKAPAADVAAPAATAVKKPFSMSYAGVTSAQHINHMIALRRG